MTSGTATPEYEYFYVSDFEKCSSLLRASDFILPSITRADLCGAGLNDLQIEALLMYHRNMVKRTHCAYMFDDDRRKLQAMVRRFQTGAYAKGQELAARNTFEEIMRGHEAGYSLPLEDGFGTPITLAVINALLGCQMRLCEIGQSLEKGYQALQTGLPPRKVLDGWVSLGPLLSTIDRIIETEVYDKHGLIASFVDFANSNGRTRDFVVMSSALLLIASSSIIRSLHPIIGAILESREIRDSMVDSDPDQVFRELLRLHTPSINTLRYDQANSSETLKRFNVIELAKANRDASQFECPHKFDPDRSNKSALTFGLGPYACDGISMTQMLLRETVRPLMTRARGLKLLEGRADLPAAIIYDSFE